MLIAYTFVLIAVGMDLRNMKISNRLILLGIIISLVRRFFCEGIDGLLTGIILISIPVILLYLLFLVGALGAGDIKLFSLIGGFIQIKKLMWCIIFAFIFATIFSLVKMLYHGVFISSIQNAMRYFCRFFRGLREPYQPFDLEKGKIHFSLAILFGLIATDLYFMQ